MRKMVLISLFFLNTFLFSQSRVNDELAIITDTGRELSTFIGWRKNNMGQWDSSYNQIPGRDSILISALKLYEVSYKNKEYYLLEILRQYAYSSDSELYIIEKNDFHVNLIKNKEITIKIKLFYFASYSSRQRRATLSDIQEKVTAELRKPSSNIPKYKVVGDQLHIYCYYYTEDDVVRFIFHDSNLVTSLPENYYFECSFEHFANFFNPVVLEE